MRSTPRLPLWPLGLGVLAAFTLGACQQAPAAAPQQPKRRSFEDSSGWQPAPAPAPASATASSADTNAQAQQIKQTWEKARQAPNEAEAQRQAGEALKQTQQMADSPPPH